MHVALSIFIHRYFSASTFAASIVVLPLFFLYTKSAEIALAAFAALVLVGSIVITLKKRVPAKRPTDALIHETSGAFPSGHAACAAGVATTLCAGYSPAPPLLFVHIFFAVLFVAIIAASRLVLRVHTPLQVLAGICIGTLIPLFVFALV